MSGSPVAWSAAVVRITTHPKVFRQPSIPADALAFAASLASAPDASLAAHAFVLGASLVTLDRGFARFVALWTVNPLDGAPDQLA